MSEINYSTNVQRSTVNVEDFHQLAKQKLPKMVYDYYSSGSDDQVTLKSTRAAYNNIKLVPRFLVDVSKQDTSIELFGIKLRTPILVAATAMHKMAHPDGELATVRACGRVGTLYTLSSLATSKIPDVAQASPQTPKLFQLYVLKSRHLTEQLVRLAEANGFQAIVLTVDTPFLGRRENDFRNQFKLPHGLVLEVYSALEGADLSEGLNAFFAKQLDSSVSWKDLDWLKSITKLPVLIKGILSPKDAELAVEHGVAGIIVSNHGARQLDTVPATIEILPWIVKAVKGKIPVLLDGGIQRGTDVLKALALGAKAVFVGRPVLWGLAANGEDGVKDVLEMLNNEFKLALALSGCTQISDITEDLIWAPTNPYRLSRL
mmetsp:Transcript_16815/g.23396  ORF Transcript_16815/g.23396 Transcript_16815/m.23396 type:complete len:375 (+) Transcript_16815:73-1197(+)